MTRASVPMIHPLEVTARLAPHLKDPLAAAEAQAFRLGFGPDERTVLCSDPEYAFRPAAVLVPLVARPDGVTVLLTQRCAHLADHAGQVSFPGGGMEPDDADIVATALREAHEEVGLPPDQSAILGALEQRGTISRYRVTPIVALVPPFDPIPQASEVDIVFEVPLVFALDAANHEFRQVGPNGEKRRYFAIPFGDRFIWGFTARILVQLSDLWHGTDNSRGPVDVDTVQPKGA